VVLVISLISELNPGAKPVDGMVPAGKVLAPAGNTLLTSLTVSSITVVPAGMVLVGMLGNDMGRDGRVDPRVEGITPAVDGSTPAVDGKVDGKVPGRVPVAGMNDFSSVWAC
jgi:hypothetical protein